MSKKDPTTDNVQKVSDLLAKIEQLSIPSPEEIEKLDITVKEMDQLNRTISEGFRLIEECRKCLSGDNKEGTEAVNSAERTLDAKLRACQKLIGKKDHEVAEAADRHVGIVGVLLRNGYYSADKDLEHNDAKSALRGFCGMPLLSILDPNKKTMSYMGAFHVPHREDATEIPAFKAALETVKAKMVADYVGQDKITPPITLRFLVNDPARKEGDTGHNTILEVTFQDNGKILLQNLDSMQSHQALGEADRSAKPQWSDKVTRIVSDVFKDHQLEKNIVDSVPNPLGRQKGAECIYFSMAEIVRHYLSHPAEFNDESTRKKAVVVQMLRASGRTEVNPGSVALATKATVAQYKEIVPNLKVGDIIYPPVLDRLYDLYNNERQNIPAATVKKERVTSEKMSKASQSDRSVRHSTKTPAFFQEKRPSLSIPRIKTCYKSHGGGRFAVDDIFLDARSVDDVLRRLVYRSLINPGGASDKTLRDEKLGISEDTRLKISRRIAKDGLLDVRDFEMSPGGRRKR